MKLLFILLTLFLFISCSNKNVVYWCGDHACVNNKEKENYFKKTMIVEVKKISVISKEDKSEFDKIKKQISKKQVENDHNEKALAKQEKKNKKEKIKKEKKLAKEIILKEKKRNKEKKRLLRETKLKEKREKKKKKKLTKNVSLKSISQDEVITLSRKNLMQTSDDFNKIVKKISKRNKVRPYPNINDIPK